MSTARMALPAAKPAAEVLEQLRHASGLLTAHELSRILRLSPKTLYSYAERNLIPHFKIETSIRVFRVGSSGMAAQPTALRSPATPQSLDVPARLKSAQASLDRTGASVEGNV